MVGVPLLLLLTGVPATTVECCGPDCHGGGVRLVEQERRDFGSDGRMELIIFQAFTLESSTK